MQLLLEILLVITIWSLIFSICIGLGLIILRICSLSCENSEEFLLSFWFGWAFLIGILQIWQLLFPVNMKIAIVIILISALSLLWNRKSLSDFISNKCFKNFEFFIFILLILVLAIGATGPITVYDTGLYHLNCIRWNTDFPLIRGLGNLHGRFAFNSSYFLYLSFLDIGPLRHLSHHFGNSLLLLVISLQILFGIKKLLTNHNQSETYNWIWINFLISNNISLPAIYLRYYK